jgi:hypothetical protein
MTDPSRPLLILGIYLRSGTNYLYDLLSQLDQCAPAGPVREDYLLAYTAQLTTYTEQVTRRWDEAWGHTAAMPQPQQTLQAALGAALQDFLLNQPGAAREGAPPRYLLSKTPSVAGLGALRTYFPAAKVIVIVRDGRSLVESGARSFDWYPEWAMRTWAAAARQIIAYQTAHPGDPDFLIVRYEDLYQRTGDEVARICAFLGIDPAGLDVAALQNLPVRGSSDLSRSGGDEVHWQPVAKSDGFNPLQRWESWSASRLARFEYLAGAEMRALGYDLDPAAHPSSRLTNRLRDGYYALRTRARALIGRKPVHQAHFLSPGRRRRSKRAKNSPQPQ